MAESLDAYEAPVIRHFSHLAASASTGEFKLVALSKAAVLNAAESANRHLESGPGSEDVWLHCLPDYHVGGLGIWARASESGANLKRYCASMRRLESHLLCRCGSRKQRQP